MKDRVCFWWKERGTYLIPTYLPTYLPTWTIKLISPFFARKVVNKAINSGRIKTQKRRIKTSFQISALWGLAINFKFYLFLKNGPTPASFIVYFRSFQTNIITNFTTNKCEKCPPSTRCWDSNPRPLEHESTPITTRPRLPPKILS